MINTTFIKLSTTAYLIISFSPHLILRLHLLQRQARACQIEPPQKPIALVQENHASPSCSHSSAHSSNGDMPVFKYLSTRYLIFSHWQKRKMLRKVWIKPASSSCNSSSLNSTTTCCRAYSDCVCRWPDICCLISKVDERSNDTDRDRILKNILRSSLVFSES
jgi:hypothetical protein